MIKNHHLVQATCDSVWSSFVTKLKYKSEWSGKTILIIGKFEPSSKICHVCGYPNSELIPKDREWKCPDCKTKKEKGMNQEVT
jgi:putative transposase